MPKRVATTFALFLVLAGAKPARAHHVISEHGIAPVAPRTVLSLDAAAASFNVEGHTGTWEATTPMCELALGQAFSVMAALPVARMAVEGRSEAMGVGDLAVATKVRLHATEHGGLLLSAGVGAELPTGSQAKGLGGGHVELTPFLTASTALPEGGFGQWLIYGVVSPRLALGAHEPHAADAAHTHGSFLAPHAERELYGRLMTALVIERGYVAAGGETSWVWKGDRAGQVAVRSELGYLATDDLRLFVALDGTVAGERRYGLRGRAGLAWLF